MHRLVAAFAVALGLSACGGASAEADRVRAAMEDYVHAVAGADDAKVCSLLTPGGRRRLSAQEGTCERSVRRAREGVPKGQFDDVTIDAVTITGDTAIVRWSPGPRNGLTAELSRIEGEWLIGAD